MPMLCGNIRGMSYLNLENNIGCYTTTGRGIGITRSRGIGRVKELGVLKKLQNALLLLEGVLGVEEEDEGGKLIRDPFYG